MHCVGSSKIVSILRSWCGVPVWILMRCFDAGLRWFGASPYWISPALLCLAALFRCAFVSQNTIFCIVDLYPRKIPWYELGSRAVSRSLDFFETILAPNVMSPSRDGIRPVHCWKGVVSIAL